MHWQVALLQLPQSPAASSVVPRASPASGTLFPERHFRGAVRTLMLATVPPVLVQHNDPPTIPPPTASSRSTRDWLVALMTWEHWNWIETQPALIHSVITTWHSDGFFLRTATEEQYQQAFGGCSTVSVCIFGYRIYSTIERIFYESKICVPARERAEPISEYQKVYFREIR
jgi:hypothetical protein